MVHVRGMYAIAQFAIRMVRTSVSCMSRRREIAGYVRTGGLDMVHMNADKLPIFWEEAFCWLCEHVVRALGSTAPVP